MAAAQTIPAAGDVQTNLDQHLQLIDAAAAEGVTLLVFPELSLTGYELALAPTLAFTEADTRLASLIAAAAAQQMTLVVGAPVRLSSGLHIAAFLIEATGAVHVYTKHHLGAFRQQDNLLGPVPPAEDAFFVAGTSNPQLSWRERALATSICADSMYPAHAKGARQRGAQIYLSCQFAIDAHMPFKMSCLKDIARTHEMTVVFSNYGGASGGLEAAGASCIRGLDGSAIARLPRGDAASRLPGRKQQAGRVARGL